MDDIQRLGHYVTNRRTECGYRTRKELADVLDFEYRVLSDIENGDRKAGHGSYAMLENKLQWKPGSIAAILDGNEPTPIGETLQPPSPLESVPTDDLLIEIKRRIEKNQTQVTESGAAPAFSRLGDKAQRRATR